MKKLQIAVIGSAGPEEYDFTKPNVEMYVSAEEIGRLLAKKKAIVVNGGKGGVMKAVSKGAKEAKGFVVAEVAGGDRLSSNEFVDFEVVTGDVVFRGPSQLVAMSDAIISLGGGAGTLQELCVAYRMKRPVVLVPGYGGWTDKICNMDYLDERKLNKFEVAETASEAVEMAINLVEWSRT